MKKMKLMYTMRKILQLKKNEKKYFFLDTLEGIGLFSSLITDQDYSCTINQKHLRQKGMPPTQTTNLFF